jgi:hypothetical protein
MKIKIFLGFYFFGGFSTQFPNTTSKVSIFCGAKVLSQEDSKFPNPVSHGVEKALFFILNTISCNLCGQLF